MDTAAAMPRYANIATALDASFLRKVFSWYSIKGEAEMFAQGDYLTATEASEYLRLRIELRDAAKAYALDQNVKNLEWVLDVSRRLLKLKRT